MYGIFHFLWGVVLSCWVMKRVHFRLIKARASSAAHTAFEVEHAVLKAHLQTRSFVLWWCSSTIQNLLKYAPSDSAI